MMHDSTAFSTSTAVRTAPDVLSHQRLRLAPVRLYDLRQVARLQRRAFKPKLAYGTGTLLLLWALPSVRFVVAREGQRIVGCAIGDRNGGQSRIVNLCVDPDSQRRGIGTDLLRTIEAQLPHGDIVLMVEADNDAARHLYSKEGYRQVGVSKSYYGRGKDGFWMQKMRTPLASAKIRI